MSVVVKGSVTPKVSSSSWSLGSGAGGDLEQQVVLPEAERQGDAEDDDADDDPGAQLVEVLDQGEAVLVGDRPDAGHRVAPQRRSWRDRLALGARSVGTRASSMRRSLVLVVVAADRAAELADAPAQRAAELGQALRPEDDQGDDQDDRDLEGSDVSGINPW